MKTKQFLILSIIISLALVSCGVNNPKEVKIALFIPSEVSSISTEWSNAANLALNQAGGKAGDIVVKFVVLDESDKDKKEPFSTAVIQKNLQETLKDPNVIAVVGPTTSGSSKLVIPILNRASVTNVSLGATWPGLTKPGYGPGEPGIYYPTGTRNFFRVTGADDVQGIAGAKWAKKLGYKSVSIVHADDAYGTGVAGVFEVTSKDVGLNILEKRSFSYDMTPAETQTFVSQILGTKPEMVYVAANNSAKNLILAFRQANSKIPIMVPDGLMLQEVIDLLGSDLASNMYGTIATLPLEELKTPAAEKFIQDYQKAYGEKPTYFSPLMYEAVGVLLRAISTAEEPTREGVLKSMRNLGGYDGVFGAWRFDEQGDISLILASGYQVQNGEWKFVVALK